MNYALTKEIYNMQPWFMDAKSLPGMLGVLQNFNSLEMPEVRYNTPGLIDAKGNTILITNPEQLKDISEDFNGIGLVNLNGPITLAGGVSSIGMEELSQTMLLMNQDNRIKSFLIRVDSGGGSSAAVETMVDTINQIKVDTPVNATIKKGGDAFSAAYGIISACSSINSESEMNGVGSCGTMIQFAGREANTGEKDNSNLKIIRFYATKSTQKNKAFEEALNNDNFKPLIDEILDPVNENFLRMIESNRPMLAGTGFDDGRDLFSKDAIGTFIDTISSFDQVVENLISQQPVNVNFKVTNNKSKEMNNEKLKQEHPEVYNSIFNAGVSSEKDRCGAWLAHLDADSTSVIEGIKSGKAITMTETQELLVKQASNNTLVKLKENSHPDLQTPESGEKDKSEVDNFYTNIDQKLNLKKVN
jgi:ClpP class serine protease